MVEFLLDNVHLCASSSQQQCEDNLSFQDKTLGIQNIRKKGFQLFSQSDQKNFNPNDFF